MGRSPCCDKLGLKKGPWTPEEDQKLLAYIEEHGHGNWRALPMKAGLQRCGKSCRLRWTNYLRPDIKRGKFSLQEEQTIIQLHALLGNRWSAIATHLPKRTDNEIKNYWNTHLKKRLAKMGIDPVTHKPKNDALLPAADGGGQQSKNAANLSHIAQWESARLEAEARLARQSKLRGTSSTSNSNNNNSSFLSPMSPDIHINDHHQIVPSVSTMGPLSSSTSSSAAAHHQYLSMTATAATATTTTPRCLDVLKAWHNVWPNNDTNTNTSTTNNNNSNSDHFICIGMGSSSGIGGGIGVGIESPTSTLSFSENAPAAVSTMGTGAGAVIEFMGHNNSDHHHHHHSHHQDMVKNEDHHHQWKRSGGGDGFDNGIEMNSLSFHDMNTLSIHQSHDHDNDHDNDNNNDDQDDHNDHGEGFIEGFTELLLSTNNNTSDTTTTKTTTNICGSKSPTKQGEENNNNNNNNDNSSGSTTRSGGSDYYEDNKTYWNSILNLVNSSPPNSPMF